MAAPAAAAKIALSELRPPMMTSAPSAMPIAGASAAGSLGGVAGGIVSTTSGAARKARARVRIELPSPEDDNSMALRTRC